MDTENQELVFFPYEAKENRDWNFARTPRFLLRNEICEFGLSACSVPVRINTELRELPLTSPNRDYPYEGFLALIQRENWKFMDCLAFGLSKSGKALILQPMDVLATTSFLNYSYAVLDSNGKIGCLNVIYWLDNRLPCLNVSFQTKLSGFCQDFTLITLPFVDIRHMYSKSEPFEHQVNVAAEEKMVEVEKDDHVLKIYTSNKNGNVKKLKKKQDWVYKLDDGFRVITSQGVKFCGENRELFIPALFRFKCRNDDNVVFNINAGLKSGEGGIPTKTLDEAIKTESRKLSLLKNSFPLRNITDPQIRNSILVRIDAFSKMRISLPQKKDIFLVPEAGAWWFRTVWFRDVYLNLLQNVKTLELLDKKLELIRNSLLLGIEYFDGHTGRVPNKLPEKASENPSYNSVDSTLLFYILACEYVRRTGDSSLANKVLDLFEKTLQSWKKASIDLVNGSPVILESGLLVCVPWHSWLDSKRTIKTGEFTVKDIPSRISPKWQLKELEGSYNTNLVWRFFNSPKFYLPEVNALWIHMLESMSNLTKNVQHTNLKLQVEMENILELARKNYLKVFWNEKENFVHDVVSYDLSQYDSTKGSPGVMAAALLQNLFSLDKLKLVWKTVRDCLLVHRKTIWLKKYKGELFPFGVLVKNYEDRVYLGDQQYHGAVVWPRDTPFLIKLLDRLEEYNSIRGLLVSNLDHQMGEGAIFYNHELFSLPLGQNPSPVEDSKNNPVPVKNPAQFWSQWVDPYLQYEL